MMKAIFVCLLLFLPVTIAIRCFIGTDMNFMQDDCKGNAKGSNFCYKQVTPHGGSSNKDCGYGFCSEDGCKGGECCCSTGDYCNGAAGSILLISLATAAAAAWLRL
ncbi:hypothetical protein PRIPAC_79461 [Pristionchus pacificus]|uniref:Uncharacterized protein n=1 Tax=Pristionchus pacificus TaxID=54126 RepID=A0A2A6BH31_PRIPA|nr:hypothetical protein PRIPAC_79461 [Pristionchus pacificus]|eukprot:PDM65204.1 hypothetical protein PRIPAC_52146 [Pristionchus pacificus]